MSLKISRARQCAGSTHLHTEQHLNLSSFTVYGTRNLSRDTRRACSLFIKVLFIAERRHGNMQSGYVMGHLDANFGMQR